MSKQKNARFWVWHNNGWVKLTLTPGQSVSFHTGGETEEGWSHEHSVYTHTGEEVESSHGTEGCDCDGRHSWSSESYCHLDDLKARDAYECNPIDENKGIMAPEWTRGSSRQYDQFAEMAGY